MLEYENIRIEVAHAQRLADQHAHKPIRKITIKDLGGIMRHAVTNNPHFIDHVKKEEKQVARRRQLASHIVQLLRANGPMTSTQLCEATHSSSTLIALAVRNLSNVRWLIGGREKTYTLQGSDDGVYTNYYAEKP
jgi:hypothetical protein